MRLSSALTLLLPLAIASTASAAKVKIVWWDPYGPPFSEPTKAMVANFNKTHPHINVVREIGGGAEISKLAVAMASGKGPDCAHIFASWSASQLWAMGLTRSMDEYLKADKKFWDQVYPAFMNSVKFRGKQLAIPDSAMADMLFWNKDAFSQAGLDPAHPPAFEDLELYAAKLTKKASDGKILMVGLNPLTNWGGFLPWASLFGGQLFDPAQEKITANSDANLKAMRWIDNFVKRSGGYAALSSSGTMEGGKVAMQYGQHFLITYIAAVKKKINFTIGLPPAPGGLGAGRGPVAGMNCHIILRNSKHPAEAYEFLKYIANGAWMQPNSPEPCPTRAANERFTPPPQIPEGTWKPVILKVLDWAQPAISAPGAAPFIDELNIGFNAMAMGKKSPEQVLQAAQLSGEKHLRDALKRARWGK